MNNGEEADKAKGGEGGKGGGVVRVRVDLFSAHVLSEFVVDMSPATNAAVEAATAAAGKHRCRAEERKPQMLHLRTRPPPPRL